MITYSSRVTIDRPAEAVFPYLVEPAKQDLWSDVPMRRLSGGALRVGSRMELTLGSGPLKATLVLEVTELVQARRLTYGTVSGPIDWDGEYRLAPTPSGGTEVAQEGRLRFKGLWRLVEPLAGAEISRGEVAELERLKTAVEAG